jgi:hypothetical protein
LILRVEGEKYLKKVGVPMTAASKVNRGEPPAVPVQGKLV